MPLSLRLTGKMSEQGSQFLTMVTPMAGFTPCSEQFFQQRIRFQKLPAIPDPTLFNTWHDKLFVPRAKAAISTQ